MIEQVRSTVDVTGKKVAISKIFKWLGEAFIPEYGNTEFFKARSEKERAVLDFIRTCTQNEEDRPFLESGDSSMDYLRYDWGLNEIE